MQRKTIVTILIVIGVLIILGLIPKLIMNNICWVARINGYRNTETGECEWFSDCPTSKFPEKYVFDENCWHESTQFGEGRNITSFCEWVCNSDNPNYSFLCNVSHYVKVNGEIEYQYCSDILS